jgi:hypothetical protein
MPQAGEAIGPKARHAPLNSSISVICASSFQRRNIDRGSHLPIHFHPINYGVKVIQFHPIREQPSERPHHPNKHPNRLTRIEQRTILDLPWKRPILQIAQ